LKFRHSFVQLLVVGGPWQPFWHRGQISKRRCTLALKTAHNTQTRTHTFVMCVFRACIHTLCAFRMHIGCGCMHGRHEGTLFFRAQTPAVTLTSDPCSPSNIRLFSHSQSDAYQCGLFILFGGGAARGVPSHLHRWRGRRTSRLDMLSLRFFFEKKQYQPSCVCAVLLARVWI
jgi:hypothetical protein